MASFKKFVKWIGETGLVNQLLTDARPHADAKKHSLSNVAHRGKARALSPLVSHVEARQHRFGLLERTSSSILYHRPDFVWLKRHIYRLDTQCSERIQPPIHNSAPHANTACSPHTLHPP